MAVSHRFRSLALSAVAAMGVSAVAHAQGEAVLPRARVAARMAVVIDTLRLINDQAALAKFQQVHPAAWAFVQEPYTPVDSLPLSLDGLNRAQLALRTIADEAYARNGSFAGNPFGGLFDNTAASVAAPLLPPQAMLVSGLADLVVERAKDEAAFGLLLTLKRQIKADSAFISTALPLSWNLVGRIDTETFQTLMPSLRSAFVQDLNELPRRMGTAEFHAAVGLRRDDAEHARKIIYLQGLSVAYARGLELRQGAPPAVALSRLVEVQPAQLDDAPARQALHLVGLLAREYAASGGTPLIDELARGEPRIRRYFFAVAAQDAGRMERGNPLLPALLAAVQRHETDAMALLNQLHSVRGTLAGTSAPNAAASGEPAANVLTASGAVLQVLNGARKLVPDAASGARFSEFVSGALHLHRALADRDYGALVTWLVQQPEIRLKGPQFRYVSLAAALSGARTAEDVTTALHTAGAPVGSFRAKRNQHGGAGPLRFSVTAYVGGAYGREETRGLAADETDGFIGLAVPVGLELSLGIPIGSFSLFAPLVDVGAVASARLGGDSVEAEPEIGIRQVFTPGIFAVVGITRSLPLSVGFGVQYVSDLRQESGGDDRVDVLRTMFFAGVETTLFRF